MFRYFHNCAVELLKTCSEQDEDMSFALLTHELHNWGHLTVLSLAAMAGNKEFISQNSCQKLISDLWQGGERNQRKNCELKALKPLGQRSLDEETTEVTSG